MSVGNIIWKPWPLDIKIHINLFRTHVLEHIKGLEHKFYCE